MLKVPGPGVNVCDWIGSYPLCDAPRPRIGCLAHNSQCCLSEIVCTLQTKVGVTHLRSSIRYEQDVSQLVLAAIGGVESIWHPKLLMQAHIPVGVKDSR